MLVLGAVMMQVLIGCSNVRMRTKLIGHCQGQVGTASMVHRTVFNTVAHDAHMMLT
jgi:hypothetical protein